MRLTLTVVLIIGISISIFLLNMGLDLYALIIFVVTLCYILTMQKRESSYEYQNQVDNVAQRTAALAQAQIFLAPYKDIWRDLRLSNKYCSITLDHDGVTIKCVEKVYPYRKMQVINSNLHTPEELWNMFCIYFSYNKSYNGVIEDCERFRVSYAGDGRDNIVSQNFKPKDRNINTKTKKLEESQKQIEPLDINNCSEIELTSLPGISIVLAKKTIKK